MATVFKKGFITRQDIAKKYAVVVATIKNWESRGLPVDHIDPGKTGTTWFLESEVDEWYEDNINGGEDVSEAKLRKLKAEATWNELKVIKAQNQVIDIKTSIQVYSKQASNIRAKLIALSSAIAARIPDSSSYQERYQLIDEEMEQILNELTIDRLTVKDWKKIAKDNDNSE